MKKTYITTMPDRIGAFLKASECLAAIGINIARVSYNKAVDAHTLFIDAEGSPEQLAEADQRLAQIGYLQNDQKDKSIVLLEFRLRDVPDSANGILTLVNSYHFNISYISSQENGSGYQNFKMGLLVEDGDKISRFLEDAKKLCQVRVIDYNRSERVYDNSIFYSSFVNGLAGTMGLSEEVKSELLVNTNLAMQMLDERGLSPYKTFDSISRFAELLAKCRGEHFSPRITTHRVADDTQITVIEPPCGSNTVIIKSRGEILFVDCGYAIYRDEMEKIFKELIPDFDRLHKKILITHPDLDHCGLLHLFDEIIASKKAAQCIRQEYEGKGGFREHNPLHKPYIKICQILTSYRPVCPDRIQGRWGMEERSGELLTYVGVFDFGELHFDVFEGTGGHVAGEIVLADYAHHIAFTGDIYINMRGLTPEQAEYNRYAPILMTSVDMDPKLCAAERNAIMERLGTGEWQIFGGHGSVKITQIP